MAGILALSASLRLLLELGCNRLDSPISSAIEQNVDQLVQQLSSHQFQVDLPEQRARRSGILSVRWPEADAIGETAYHQARKFLLEQNVVTSVRAGKLRIATHAYNNAQDIERLVDALKRFQQGR
jgi:selenocysteine lyase/cysteine desulfurase